MKQKNIPFAWWNTYQKYVRQVVLPQDEGGSRTISYWSNEIFCSIITYITPLSIIALIPGVYMSFRHDLPVVGFVDLLAFMLLIVVMINRSLSLGIRKFIFISIFYILAIVLIHYVGKAGPGLLFLMVLTVLSSIIYSPSVGYISAWINTGICIAFGILEYFGEDWPAVIDYSLGTWIAVTSNLVLLSFACAKCLDLLLNGLSKSLQYNKNSENELASSSSNLKRVLNDFQKTMDSSLDIICSIDEKGRFVKISAAAENILGYMPHELIGKKYIDMVYTEDLQKTNEAAVNVMNGTSLTLFENRYLHKKGNIVQILWSATWDNKDKLMYCIAKDVTERKKVEQQLSVSEKSNRDVLIDLTVANKELVYQNEEKEKRAAELIIANKELVYQNEEKEKRAAELIIANEELLYQNEEKEKRAAELIIANKELVYQNEEKEKRAAELIIANIELIYQNDEREDRAAELIIANKELVYQNEEKGNRASELVVANEELIIAKRLKEFAKNNLKALINNTNDLMWSVDRKFKLITSNEPFDKMIKIISGTDILKGDNALSIAGPSSENLIRYKKYYKRAFAGESFTEIECIDSGLYAEVSFHPIRKGDEIIGTACHSHDITERKKAEEEKKKMTEDIVKRSKHLEQFAYIVSHNLRAPVANIMGLSNILKDRMSIKDRNRSQQFLFVATEKLDEIVKDLNIILQVRSEINEFKETISLEDLVKTIKSSIQILIEREAVEISTNFDRIDEIKSIKSYVHSIFHNLISNSVKYSQAGKPPIITISSEKADGKIKIFYKDNGLGMDLEKYGENVFGLYKRFHFHTEGKGLGLFMVKTQVETLGGNIQIYSKPGEGVEFIIELPL